MGLERVAAVIQGKLSNYDTDLFTPIIDAVARRAGKAYGKGEADDVSLRVVADHLRAMTFLVADGVLPGNEGRGYVLRKIMRRAMSHGQKLGIEGLFLHQLTHVVVARMKAAYPDLVSHEASVARIVSVEEERFGETLKDAIPHARAVIASVKPLALSISGSAEVRFMPAQAHANVNAPVIEGRAAFRLYDTYGLPLDFLDELAAEQGVTVDHAGFERELAVQQERARQSSKMGVVKGDPVFMKLADEGVRTDFLGYSDLVVEDARVLAVLQGGTLARRLDAGEVGQIVLDRTPFYAMAGGQVGDRGVIASDGSAAEVSDTTAPLPGLHVHQVTVTHGGFERGMRVRAEVDVDRRAATMRHHTGTHLLHAALRETLGPHVKQAGSLVAPDRLRFDFSHYAPVGPRELRHVENRVNGEILRDARVEKKVMGREEALAYGALAFFGDKYGERVRVVEVPGFSKEFCGGTHVDETGEIGLFLVTGEQGISAGTRRVEALAGALAAERAQADQGILDELEQTAKVDRKELVDEYARLREQLKARDREVQALKMKLATAGSGRGEAASDQTEVAGAIVWTPRFEGLDRKAHAAVVDEFRNRNRERRFAVVSTSTTDDGVSVITAVSQGLTGSLNAPEVMKKLGLRGGGRPEFAQGGGVAPGDVETLREKARELLRGLLEKGNA
jgi:alanyl-tRNA synthetase